VGDDRIALCRRGASLIVSGHPLARGLIERRGQGIVRVPHETAAVARLAADLLPAEDLARYPRDVKDCVTYCGVDLPILALSETMGSYDSALIILARLRQTETI
jgi:hypothetical protein